MDIFIGVMGGIWIAIVTGFMLSEAIKGIRSKKMSYITQGIGTTYTGTTSTGAGMTNIMAETIHSGGVLHVSGKGLVWAKPNGTHIDIAKAAEIFWFFLAQHPEIVEQFNAIEKIKES